MNKIHEKHIGSKLMYAVEHPETGTMTVRIDCAVYEMAEFGVPINQGRAYFDMQRRPNIQDLFPGVDHRVREIMVTGITPAEWDEIYCEQGSLPPEGYPCYANVFANRAYEKAS